MAPRLLFAIDSERRLFVIFAQKQTVSNRPGPAEAKVAASQYLEHVTSPFWVAER